MFELQQKTKTQKIPEIDQLTNPWKLLTYKHG